jgi:DNA-binding NtrC family response regulator
LLSGDLAITTTEEKGTLVLMEPDASVRDALVLLLKGEGWQIVQAEDCESMEKELDRTPAMAVISESSLPDCSPGQILDRCRTRGLPVIFTGHDLDLQGAVDLIRDGALDYLDKPFPQGRLVKLLEGLCLAQNAAD